MEPRKQQEIAFHDKLRALTESDPDFERLTSNVKYYSALRAGEKYWKTRLVEQSRGKRVLDYCCGEGSISLWPPGIALKVVGIDISPVSIAKASRAAEIVGSAGRTAFLIMDAENTGFRDGVFDVILCAGVLHHLDIERAYRELVRLLRSDGSVICIEPLGYNPVFNLYRRLTPHLRTKWEMEHILRRKDLVLARHYFHRVDERFFGLTALAAVPFRNLRIFKSLLRLLEFIDGVLLRIPVVKWLAKTVVFVLSEPNRDAVR